MGLIENVKLVLTLNAKLPFTQWVPGAFFPGVMTCTTPITSTSSTHLHGMVYIV
jgi:hypothetical protein